MISFEKFDILKKTALLALILLGCKNYAQEIPAAYLNKINASNYRVDTANEDGVFIAQNSTTKKWGMYQLASPNQLKEIIPMAYDSIGFYAYNSLITDVWIAGKVGIYTSPWSYRNAKQTVPCLYDNFQIFQIEKTINSDLGYNTNYKTYLAVQKNGLWAWIDW